MDAWTAELRRWPMLLVFVCGETSNILSVLVLARPKLRKNTCSLYLLGASISNTICIFVGLLYFVISSGFGYSLISKTRGLCKFIPFIYYSTLFLASWFILLACIDRYCSTHSRAIIRRFSHINTAKWCIVILPFISFILHIHILINFDWIQIGRCSFITFSYLLFLYSYYVAIYAFMTPILYIVFAALTINNVRKTKKTVTLVVKRNGIIIQSKKRLQTLDAQLLRMLLVQVISFFILTMPLAVWNVYIGINYYKPKTPLTISLEALLAINFRFLTYISIGSTCVVYVLTSRLFREELWALFRCQWFKKTIKHQQRSRLFFISQRIVPT
ncbi:unnamed protein product [Rotaria sordida]|uniref:G-protein coupled receptors family 1 profile domain-containing protein n=1 Tax=Rotaria sordida TaxID=392033 RepID=A0A814FY19_9BILA|nr:unnamed protein product [Rotaria sordida]CAF1009238.1 unnamed protein product [Rotaria sordida]CAF3800892.1 unnamed protein product [Rotaria sordida]CAF3875445.1 unnamed protein product [Rotaria sordida]